MLLLFVAGSFVAVVTAVVARLVTRSFVAVLAAVVGKPFRLTRAPRAVKEGDERHRLATPSNGLAAPSEGRPGGRTPYPTNPGVKPGGARGGTVGGTETPTRERVSTSGQAKPNQETLRWRQRLRNGYQQL